MKQIVKQIAEKTFKSIPMDNNKPEEWIDSFVLAYTKAILFEATDVMRESAHGESPEVNKAMKVAVIDVLDHFGV